MGGLWMDGDSNENIAIANCSFLGDVASGGAGAALLIGSENLCIELRNLYFFENKQVVMGEGEGKVKIYIDSSNRQVAAPPRWATLESKKR
jgi:hypothetical protein